MAQNRRRVRKGRQPTRRLRPVGDPRDNIVQVKLMDTETFRCYATVTMQTAIELQLYEYPSGEEEC